MTKFQRKLLLGLIVLALLTPLGLLLPEIFNSGGAWGEWGTDALERLLGYVPEGLKRTSDIFKSPIEGYSPGKEDAPLIFRAVFYIISGLIGTAAVALTVYLTARLIRRKRP